MPTTIVCRTALPYPPSRAWELLNDRRVIEGRTGGHDVEFGASVLGHRYLSAPTEARARVPTPCSTPSTQAPLLLIETTGTVPTSWLPGWVAPHAVGRMPAVYRTETWQLTAGDRLDGDMTFTIAGVEAAAAAGRMWIRSARTGSELRQEVTIAVRFPLVGGIIERSLAVRVRQSLQVEASHLATY